MLWCRIGSCLDLNPHLKLLSPILCQILETVLNNGYANWSMCTITDIAVVFTVNKPYLNGEKRCIKFVLKSNGTKRVPRYFASYQNLPLTSRRLWLYWDIDITINKGPNVKINLCTVCSIIFLKFDLFTVDACGLIKPNQKVDETKRFPFLKIAMMQLGLIVVIVGVV